MRVHVLCASGKKEGQCNNFLRFRALFGTIFRVMIIKKIREVRWHVVSIVLFLNILWGNCMFSTFYCTLLKIVHALMHFLKMIFLRGELMRITFDVGRVTVQEYMRTIPRKFRKLHILISFKEYFDKKMKLIYSSNGNSLPFFCWKSTRVIS